MLKINDHDKLLPPLIQGAARLLFLTRYYCGDLTKSDLTNDNQFSEIENKRKIVLESLVYTDKSTLEFKPNTDIIKEVKL